MVAEVPKNDSDIIPLLREIISHIVDLVVEEETNSTELSSQTE